MVTKVHGHHKLSDYCATITDKPESYIKWPELNCLTILQIYQSFGHHTSYLLVLRHEWPFIKGACRNHQSTHTLPYKCRLGTKVTLALMRRVPVISAEAHHRVVYLHCADIFKASNINMKVFLTMIAALAVLMDNFM